MYGLASNRKAGEVGLPYQFFKGAIMSNMRSTPNSCKECVNVDVIRAENGNPKFQICNLHEQECSTAITHCNLVAKYELVVADYSRLLAFDLFRDRL